jgi:glycosyltransferase involved in cell wall biosynthesis
MEKIPFFSIIIPTYERKDLLYRSVKSVINQTYNDWQCLIIDDGSKNSSWQEEWQSITTIEYYHFPQNHGVAWSRNQGYQLAKGQWIAFLDSDDEWHPEKLQDCKKFIDKKPKYYIFQTDEIWIRNARRVNPRKHHLKKSGNLFHKSLHRCMITVSSLVVHRFLFANQYQWDEKLLVCEDYDLGIQIAAKYPIGYLAKKLTIRYQGHNPQLSTTYQAMDQWRIYVLKKFILSSANQQQKQSAIIILKKKLSILKKGAFKRKKYFFLLKLFLKYQWLLIRR